MKTDLEWSNALSTIFRNGSRKMFHQTFNNFAQSMQLLLIWINRYFIVEYWYLSTDNRKNTIEICVQQKNKQFK